MIRQKIGELNGLWAFLTKLALALVPIITVTGMSGVIYQIRFNTKVESFMNVGDRYTAKMAIEDHMVLRSEFEKELHLIDKQLETARLQMQLATPEAARRLSVIEQSLSSIQADITAMSVSLAQIRINGAKGDKEPKP